MWEFGGSLVQAIFAGREEIRSGVRFSEARQQENQLTYQQTIQQAFVGVSTHWWVSQGREFRSSSSNWHLCSRTRTRLSKRIEAAPPATGGTTNATIILMRRGDSLQAQLKALLGLVSI